MIQRAVSGPQDLRQALEPRLLPVAGPPAVQTQAASPAEDTGAAGEEQGQGGGQELEAMAQEVYRIIRRRLTVERERERGRV